MKEKFSITGMSCSACSARVDKAINAVDGVENATVNLLTNTMEVEFDENKITEKDIIDTVIKSGYGADKYVFENKMKKENDKNIKETKTRLIVSFVFLIPLMYISMSHMFSYSLPSIFDNHIIFAVSQLVLSLPVVAVNYKYFTNGFKSLFKGSPNMDTLIAIGSSAALIYGIYAIIKIIIGVQNNDMETVHQFSMDLYFESSAMILALITFGKFLETKSKGKTSDAINKLIDLTPKTAFVKKNGEVQEILSQDIKIGDVIVIKQGQTIPVDGEVLIGECTIDQSAITGESVPVEKEVNDKVIAGSICSSGYFEFKATKVGEDTTLSQIITLVEQASSSKAPIAKLADKISGIFVPIVIVIAIISAIVWFVINRNFEFALSIGISVLVISCPCALGLATPVAIMVGTGNGAENGILIKSASALETTHLIDTVVLDKTGTITQGKPTVSDVEYFINKQEFINIIYSMELKSEHPLSKAVVEYCKNNGAKEIETENFENLVARGVKCSIKGKKYFGGNLKLTNENNIDISKYSMTIQNYARQAKTPLIFTDENMIIGIIAIVDKVKNSSIKAIEQFNKLGINTIMVTGDNKITADSVKAIVGIKQVISDVLPQDKEKIIADLQKSNHKVAMIGDGINDAPALARADVGIAIGAGTDIAIDAADIVLIKSDLLDAVTAVKLSTAVIKNIKTNLFWAFFYNSLGIPLAAGIFYGVLGWKLNPMFAAAAMSLSSVCVVLNALRLRLFKNNK